MRIFTARLFRWHHHRHRAARPGKGVPSIWRDRRRAAEARRAARVRRTDVTALFSEVPLSAYLFAVLALFVVRPIAIVIALARSGPDWHE
jgi:hypothetical protein